MSPTYVTTKDGLDYGPRPKTLGLSFHMTEGNGGVGDVNFLTRRAGETRAEWAKRVSGVSAHVVLTTDGTLYQMLPWGSACGNLNPNDRAEEYTYYGHHHLVDVLGDWWTNPNAATLSMEIAGKRADGPTDAQVESAIAWGLDMRDRFPSIRGATGHHDQSPKPCPGLKPNMKSIFDGVGGHGLFVEEPVIPYTILKGPIGSIEVNADPDVAYKDLITGKVIEAGFTSKPWATPARLKNHIVTDKPSTDDDFTLGYLIPDSPAFILARNVTFTPIPGPAPDCTEPIAAAVKVAVDKTKASAKIKDPAIVFGP